MLLTMISGCAPTPGSSRPTGAVKVRVTIEGAEITTGLVQFTNSANGISSAAELDVEGTASLSDVVVGSYQVVIIPPSPEPGDPELMDYNNIPERYRSFNTTPLTAEVTSGDNKFEFALDSNSEK
ncbi:MAG TPA: hypothetical protein DD473_00800 [Planctomycetaceae bacterium]|nr:hypothetical protein [Planctomycetaceae bacterium]